MIQIKLGAGSTNITASLYTATMTNDQTTATLKPFQNLSPDTILAAVETRGFLCDGRLLALNSYENRVYQIGVDDSEPVIAKFYRPGRWTDDEILEEHAFALELASHEIPLIAPLLVDGASLFEYQEFRFSLSPRCGGRAVELDQDDTLKWLGRFLGRMHAIGASKEFVHRPVYSVQRYGWDSRTYLLTHDWLPAHLKEAFAGLTNDLLAMIDERYQAAADCRQLRLHGDFHAGNILWRDGPFFVDLDDCQTGYAIQDLWLLLAGDGQQMSHQFDLLMEGYEMFRIFDGRELGLIESLRSLRMLHHSAWLARRWEDPAFPMAFTWFDSTRYWEELVLSLREQLAAVQEPALSWSKPDFH